MRGIGAGLLLIILLVGCQTAPENEKQLEDHAAYEQHKADEAKEIILSMKEVTEVKGVNHEGHLYLAPSVKPFDRFRLKEIREKGHDSVKKHHPEATVFFSTDKKIYMELDKLEDQLKNKQISEKQLKGKLKKLEEMMKG